MSDKRSKLSIFVRRVYRRLIWMRILESAGLGVLAGSVLGLVLVGVLFWRGESALLLAELVLPLSALGGVVWAVLRRPTALNAAIEADRQLDLADLLATAWLLERNQSGDGDAFAAAVISMAEARCATLFPSTVLLNRLGARAWGGIGLAGALVLTLGLMSANPLDSQAAANESAGGKSITARSEVMGNPQTAGSSRKPGTAIVGDVRHEGDNSFDTTPNTSTTKSGQAGANDAAQSAANPDGSGSGAGQSHSSPNNAAASPVGTQSKNQSPGGTQAGGVGAATENATTGRGPSAQSAGGSSSRAVPPWSSDSWPAAQQAADAALRTGQIPPAYHDLVREYFDRR
jgi:hypothetical protein